MRARSLSLVRTATIACILAAGVAASPQAADGHVLSRTLAIAADAAELAGHGPAENVEYVPATDGTLYVWAASSELDPFLRIESAAGEALAEDDQAGGGTTARLRLAVTSGRALVIRVAAGAPGEAGAVELHCVLAPENDATRAVLGDMDEGRERARALFAEKQLAAAQAVVAELIDAVRAADPESTSAGCAEALRKLAFGAAELGDTTRAREAFTSVLAHREHCLPPDDRELQIARRDLAEALLFAGDARGALRLQEQVVEVFARTLPEDHEQLQMSRTDLANSLYELGDVQAASVLIQAVHDTFARTLPADHRFLQAARLNLAVMRYEMGDLDAARELAERALEVLSRAQSTNDELLHKARENLAITLMELGELQRARELLEGALAASLERLPEDHPSVLRQKANLAIAQKKLGDLAGARALEEQLLAAQLRAGGPENIQLNIARINLACTLSVLGESAPAAELAANALASYLSFLPPDHDYVQRARQLVAICALQNGERERAVVVMLEVAAALGRSLRFEILSASPREAAAFALAQMEDSSRVLAIATEAHDACFQLVESLRAAPLASARILRSAPPSEELRALREDARRASAALAQLGAAGATREDYTRALVARDSAQQRILALVSATAGAEEGARTPQAAQVARALEPDEALICFWSYHDWQFAAGQRWEGRVPHMLAFVVRPDAALARIELGPSAPIESAVEKWRSAVLAGRPRGAGAGESGAPDPRAAGEALRALTLDPLRPHLGDARRWVLVPDGVLHQVPFDALPLEDAHVGDRWEIRVRSSAAELLWRDPARTGAARLLALGAIDYDAAAADESASAEPSETTAGGAPVAALRSPVWERGFPPLPQTRGEVDGIRELFSKAHGAEAPASVLSGASASKAALVRLAPTARFLHMATHGYFAPESVASTADERSLDPALGIAAQPQEERVKGLSPLVVCGLALAGANLPPDRYGRVAGTLTAEELSALDLTGCELALLSACDSHVGVQRTGLGVASLQRALNMAGARSVIASLWKVDDEAARELMVDFYRRLWVLRQAKSTALWQAKVRLRELRDAHGRPRFALRDWAGWILTGAPD